MKDKLIGEIREVFISAKTYPEYVEALADHLSTKGYRKASDVIDEFAERFMKKILENTVGNDSLAYFLKGYIDQIANEMKGADNG